MDWQIAGSHNAMRQIKRFLRQQLNPAPGGLPNPPESRWIWRSTASRRGLLILRQQLNTSMAEYIRVSLQGFKRKPPVVIYQMGKVGSQTVYRTLRAARLPNPVYHVHWLSPDSISDVEERYRNSGTGIMPRHLITSRILRRRLDRDPQASWFIITLVRDPVARTISEFFELVRIFYPELITSDGSVHADRAIEVLQRAFENFDESTDRACTWFDRELKAVFGIDVFTHPFGQQGGYSFIRDRDVQVLVLRLEDLDRNIMTLARFLSLSEPLHMVRANLSTTKEIASAHRFVLDNLCIPKPVCARIYSSRYAEHFYTGSMRSAWVQQWTRA
jgi:hypothetical protein